jgi:hypothetical protein
LIKINISENKIPLIFIWLGNKFPLWGLDSLKLNKETSNIPLILITSKSINKINIVDEHLYLEDFYVENDLIKRFDSNNIEFRNGFWINTTKRFFVIYQFMKFYKFNKVFHAELDNLIFNISTLSSELDKVGNGLFCPRDSEERGIASLIYINNIESLKIMNAYFLVNKNNINNDMQLLGFFLKNDTKSYFSLPVENSLRTCTWENINYNKIKGIFDAASIGQFLLGIDPMNINGILYNGFENENKGCNLWDLKFILNRNLKSFEIYDTITNKKVNLYNIHFHSKLFSIISNFEKLEKIIQKLNNGEKSILIYNWRRWRILHRFFK